jgi:UV excision repair protein RAD23
MNGIPPAVSAQPASAAAATSTTSSLDALRNHPQFNDLRRLVQSNPSTLQTVLAQIGQQQPDLLRAINENQAEFLRMMNEPVSAADTTTASTTAAPSSSNTANLSNPFAMDPSQLPALLSSMPPAELSSMAQMMGMTVEQLQQTSQMISQIPPEEYAQYMNMAAGIRGMDMGNIANLISGAGGGGGQVLRLNEEEMAAVNRLTEMGFD